MAAHDMYACGAYAAGLAITLFLAAYLTPRQWWRRANARALLIMVVGAWGFGSLILYAADAARPASAAVLASEKSALPITKAPDPNAIFNGKPFQVHRDLNLRASAGVDAPRMITVPAGATVSPTGERHGDWWQIKVTLAGRESTGWVSSLWLRRDDE